MTTAPIYTTLASTEWSIGTGVNGTGRRVRISGHYVVDPDGRRCRAFTGKDSEAKAIAWAAHCNTYNLPRFYGRCA